MKTHTGVIRGNIIELSEDPGLPNGAEVDIQVTTRKDWRPGEGLKRCAGGLRDGWSAVDDQILTEIERGRLDTPHRELPQ
jgi:hypothetical protein